MPKTNRVEVLQWQTPAGSFGQEFELAAWRLTIYPFTGEGGAGADLTINGVVLNLINARSAAPVTLGGAYSDGKPINTLFQGTYVSPGPTMVFVEYTDPDIG